MRPTAPSRLLHLAFLLPALTAASCTAPGDGGAKHAQAPDSLRRYERTQTLMGVPFRVVLYARDEVTGNAAAEAALTRVGRLEAVLFNDGPGSELARVYVAADAPAGDAGPVKIHDDLFHVLQQAAVVSARSNGAFDVTAGP